MSLDQLQIADFHRKAFERANGSPSGRGRVNVREGSPSSYCKCRNDAGNRIEGGKDKERIAFDRKEKRERNKRNKNAQNVPNIEQRVIGHVIYRDGALLETRPKRQKRNIVHQSTIHVDRYTFATGSALDGALWTCDAVSKKDAIAKFKEKFHLSRLPANALMFINGKAVK